MKTKLMFFLTLTSSFILNCHAGSATWKLDPVDGNWDNQDNWQPATVPNGPLDTATFRASNVTNVKIGSIIEVSDIIFAANASAFIITVQIDRHHPPYEFTLSGSGGYE